MRPHRIGHACRNGTGAAAPWRLAILPAIHSLSSRKIGVKGAPQGASQVMPYGHP